jgi:3-hydroxyacyl-[acyl-carrier-protein] dehydratase
MDTSKRVIGFTELKETFLPQRYPLLMLDRITDYSPGIFIEAVKAITGNSPELVGHFPERAILPGSSLMQAISQLAIVFFKLTNGPITENEMTVISSFKIRLTSPIPPGVLLSFRMTPKLFTPKVGIFNAEAVVEGRTVAKAQVTLAKTELDTFQGFPW